MTSSRTQRLLVLAKEAVSERQQSVLGVNEDEQPVSSLKDISNFTENGIVAESIGLAINSATLPDTYDCTVLLRDFESSANKTLENNKENNQIAADVSPKIAEEPMKKNEENEPEKVEENVPITPDFGGSSSSSSSDSSDSSSSSDSESSSSESTSSKNSNQDPFGGSDDSVKDPDYNHLPAPHGDSSNDEERDVRSRNRKRKVQDPCNTEKVGKKRMKNVDKWRRNVTKKLRNSGESYISSGVIKNQDGTKATSMITRPARCVLPPCGTKCKLKCSEKVTPDQRKTIFDEYWSLKNLERQREFISLNMQTVNPTYKYSQRANPRKPNNAYCFLIQQEQVRVCKYFFMATLAINHRVVSTVLRKRNICESSKVIETDKRGKHGNHKRIDPSIKEGVRNHINSIPRVESHYCRSHSSKEYIEGNKTIADLHRDYTELCQEQNLESANYFMYSKVFNEEFNLAFHLPKKDQCELCLQYRNSDDGQKREIEEKYTKHIKEKDLSRKAKEQDKNSDDRKVIVFDLQAVLPCPTGDASSFYYVSKLNVLNFTLYDIKSREGTCFLWHEGEANRGANEIGSCVLEYLRVMAQQTQGDFNVVFYSDNCAGQNKNKFVIAMYMYALFSLGIKSITHKYFVTGHGQSEGDSMHAMIEKEVKKFKKSSPIYAPDQYACIIRAARKNAKPYKVNEMCHKDFVDLKALSADLFLNIPRNVKITEIREFKVDRQSPNTLFYKTSFEQSVYNECKIINARKAINMGNISLKKAYATKPGITDAKKNGILSLIEKKRCVPMYYLDFYKNL